MVLRNRGIRYERRFPHPAPDKRACRSSDGKCERCNTEFAARGFICKNHTCCTAINLHLLAWQYTATGGMHSLLTSPLAKAYSSSHISGLISKLRFQKKKPTSRVGFFFWQRNRDSNPNIQSQSLLCYRYTIPLRFSA